MENKKMVLNTRIDKVIVYKTGVQITEVSKSNLSKGEQLLTITNLSETIDKESVRVKGIGNGKIINIMVEFNSKKEYKKEEYKKLSDSIEKIEKEMKKKGKELERLNEQITKYKNMENLFYTDWSKAYAFGEVDLHTFSNFNEKINDYIVSKIELVQVIEDKNKELLKELQVLRNKISKLGPIEEVHNFYEITIDLNVLKEGEFNIEISYTIKQAYWIPFYDVSLSEQNARLIMMAHIFNNTGIDWNNVQIEISTASLKPIMLIKPNPMILQEYVPIYYKGGGRTKYDGFTGGSLPAPVTTGDTLGGALKKVDMGPETGKMPEEPKTEIKTTYAEVSENIGVQLFKISNRIDIPSDKNPHPVNLTIQELETKKKYYWSSIMPENVIIQDTLINGDLLLLAGNCKIYYAEEFIGETVIPVIAPKERFKLGTRVSYDFRIEKKLIDRSKDKKSIKGRLKNNYEYKIIIRNLNNVSEDLTLYDRIPHSSSENIKIEFESINPEPDKKELGILKWRTNMKGIQEKVIQYKYSIEYKQGININPPLP
jgi:uncharacterized protein (TIGR02231 family)